MLSFQGRGGGRNPAPPCAGPGMGMGWWVTSALQDKLRVAPLSEQDKAAHAALAGSIQGQHE